MLEKESASVETIQKDLDSSVEKRLKNWLQSN